MAPLFHEDIASVQELRKLLIELTTAYEKLLAESKATMKQLQDETEKSTKVTSDHVKVIKDEKDKYTQLLEEQKKLIKIQQDNEKAVNRATEARKKQVNQLREANSIAQQEAKTIDEMRKKVAALNLLWKNSEIGTKTQKELAAQLARTTAELKKQEAAVGIHSRNVGNYASAIKNGFIAAAAAATGVIVALRGVFTFMSSAVEAAGAQEKAERQLAQSLGYTSKALLAQANALQQVTTFEDDATVEAMAYLSYMGLTEKQIKKIIPLIQDMAAAKGMDLSQAADLVAKSIGSSTNAMARYGIEIEGAAGSSERLESAVAALTMKFGGQAEAIASTGIGALTQWSNAWGELKEQIGNKFLPFLAAIARKMSGILYGAIDPGAKKRGYDDVQGFLDDYEVASEETQAKILKTTTSQKDYYFKKWEGAQNETDKRTYSMMFDIAKEKYEKILGIIDRSSKGKIKIEGDTNKKLADAELKAEEERWKAIKRHAEEQGALYTKLSAERVKDESDAYKLSKDLGTASYQEVYDYELNLITSSAAFRVLLEGKTAEEVLRIWREASDKAKQAAKGFRVSGLPTESSEFEDMGPMPDFAAVGGFDPEEIVNPDAWKETFDKINNYAQLFGGAISDVLRMISAENQRQYEMELSEAEKRYTTEEKLLDEQLRNKSISENQYNARKMAAEQKRQSEEEKLKKEYAKKQRDIQLTQAIINTALSVTSALTTPPIWLGIIMAVIAAALGAAEIATISNAQFAKGGHMMLGDKGTTLKGKRHSQGGVNLGEVGTAEAGEYIGIISRPMTQKYKSELPLIFDSLNQGSFERTFDIKGVIVPESRYTKKMYEHMVAEKKPGANVTVTDTMIITQMGNHTVKTYL